MGLKVAIVITIIVVLGLLMIILQKNTDAYDLEQEKALKEYNERHMKSR